MSFLFTMTVLAGSLLADNERRIYFLLYVNNVQHMTIERWTTPRVIKRYRVLDAETRKPVPRARIVCVHNFDWMEDWAIEGIADAEGVASVSLARDYVHLLHIHVGADGYLTRDSLTFRDSRDDIRQPGMEPGMGKLTDDPIDIFLYRGPEPSAGLRLPAGFRGTIVYRGGGTAGYHFAFPPDFPAGQRVWWTDVVAGGGGEPILASLPRMGFAPDGSGDDGTFAVVDADGRRLARPDPGAVDVDGVAAWSIGNLERGGPWGGSKCVMVIGDRDAALAEARRIWEQHHNGRTGYVYDGWLRVISPQTPRSSTTENPNFVTRIGLDR